MNDLISTKLGQIDIAMLNVYADDKQLHSCFLLNDYGKSLDFRYCFYDYLLPSRRELHHGNTQLACRNNF